MLGVKVVFPCLSQFFPVLIVIIYTRMLVSFSPRMSKNRSLKKIDKELNHLINQSETLTSNLKATRRLIEKEKSPKVFNLCGLRLQVGKNELSNRHADSFDEDIDSFDD